MSSSSAYRYKGDRYLFIGVLTDNCLILPSDDKILQWFLTEYKKYYTITGGEVVDKYNGVHIEQDRAKSIVQPPYRAGGRWSQKVHGYESAREARSSDGR